MNVLVATPARKTTRAAFLSHSEEVYESLTWPEKDRALYLNDFPPGRGRYHNNARARNGLIETYLKPKHTHVLWMDVDMVEVPTDLIEQLTAITTEDIVAPFVLIEGTERFYDVGGFQQFGCWFDFAWPHCLGGVVSTMPTCRSGGRSGANTYRGGMNMGADMCRKCGGRVVRLPRRGKPGYHCFGCGADVTKREYRLREIEAEPCPLCGSQVVRVKKSEFKCRGCGNSRVDPK